MKTRRLSIKQVSKAPIATLPLTASPHNDIFAKVKYQVFIDLVVVELFETPLSLVTAVLKDEEGRICCTLETNPEPNQRCIEWKGLNDLPYGIYTLELCKGGNAMKTRMVKRV